MQGEPNHLSVCGWGSLCITPPIAGALKRTSCLVGNGCPHQFGGLLATHQHATKNGAHAEAAAHTLAAMPDTNKPG